MDCFAFFRLAPGSGKFAPLQVDFPLSFSTFLCQTQTRHPKQLWQSGDTTGNCFLCREGGEHGQHTVTVTNLAQGELLPEPGHRPAEALGTVSTEGTFITCFLRFPLHKAEYWPGMGFSVALEQDQGRGACLHPLDGC